MNNKQRIKQLEDKVAYLERELARVAESMAPFARIPRVTSDPQCPFVIRPYTEPNWQYSPSVTHVIDYGQFTKDGLPVIRWTL